MGTTQPDRTTKKRSLDQEPVRHRPQPGPGYWDWRCLVCGEPVEDHPPLGKKQHAILRALANLEREIIRVNAQTLEALARIEKEKS